MTSARVHDLREEGEKLERRKTILNILEKGRVGTQTDLVREVRKHGFSCTQTTISRDLAELQVIKVGGVYRPWSEAPIATLERALTELGISVVAAGVNLVVIRTRAGGAQTVAIELDRSGWKEVVGTVAGDDTIFIAVAGRAECDAVVRRIRKNIGLKE
ncbi:MAG: arginine repressor [Pseudomonadota bacterium]